MNFFGGPDNGPATGANILSRTGTAFTGTLQAKGPGPYKGEPLFSKALNKFKGFRGKGCFVPAVLLAFLHGQAVGFSGFLKLLVVVGARS